MQNNMIDSCNEVTIDILESWLKLSNRSIIIEDGKITEVIKNG